MFRKSIFKAALLILLLFVAGYICGCGSSGNSSPGTRMIISHELERLDSSVDYMYYKFLDEDNTLIYGPISRQRENLNIIDGVPTQTKIIEIEYYDNVNNQQGTKVGEILVGKTSIPVDIGDENVINVCGNPAGNVHFVKTNGTWALMVGGKPFNIKGVTGDYGVGGSINEMEWTYAYLNSQLQASGANVIRTYGASSTDEQVLNVSKALELAHKLSKPDKPIMVIVGFEFGFIPDPVTMNNNAADKILQDKNADHILTFCLSNEYADPGNPQSQNNKNIAAVLKHCRTKTSLPMMISIGIPNPTALANINSAIPGIDLIGFNTFYGKYSSGWEQTNSLALVNSNLGSWSKPWAILEYYSYDLPSIGYGNYKGMPYKEINGYKYFLELNSTANAQNYKDSWQKYIVSADAKKLGCVGGCALNWMPPHNSQCPYFWKHMFVYKGAWKQWDIGKDWYQTYGADRLECVDAVTGLYGGTIPSNKCPRIVTPNDGDLQGIGDCNFKVTVSSSGREVSPGEDLTASVTATDPENDSLTFDWYLTGGIFQHQGQGGITAGPSIETYKVWGIDPVTSVIVGHGTSSNLGGGTIKNTVSFKLDPATHLGNNYQLRVIVRDGKGGAATAAIGFPVKK